MACNILYNTSITGDCANINSGSFTINISGTGPYSIQWVSPFTGTTSLGLSATTYSRTSLSATTYTFNIIDSCSPNTIVPVNIYISSGTSVSITNFSNTICGGNNGSLTASTSNIYGTPTFSLYNNTGGFVSSGASYTNTFVFTSLSSGTYYVIANDGGGCVGKSETCIIKESNPIDYDFYIVDDAGCKVNSGKMFISGLTGTPPYTYLWSNGSITNSISDLSTGVYSVTVTDNTGCSVSKSGFVGEVTPVGFGVEYLKQPTCFSGDGEVTIVVTDGTPPFYYLGSNGVTNVTFDRTVTFSGLSAGLFTIQVTDAGLCNFISSVTLQVPMGISSVSVETKNSKCNDLTGQIGPIHVFGGVIPYTYTLTDFDGNIISQTSNSGTWTFNNLSSGTYLLTVSDSGTESCVFMDSYTVNNDVLYDLTVTTTGTTCDGNDGVVTLDITSGGTPPYLYKIDGKSIKTSLTSYTFNNLVSGNYVASVTDALYCYQSTPFTIDESNTIDFHLLSQNAINDDGIITAYITNGTPPFTLYFNGDTVGTTVMSIPDLPIGDYSVRIVDSSGCSKTKNNKIGGYRQRGSIGSYNVCSGTLDKSIVLNSNIRQFFYEGYNELILTEPTYSNCILTGATFSATTTIGDCVKTELFYHSTTITDYPSDEDWFLVITSLIESCPQIGSGNVLINSLTNTITVTTNCDLESLHNSNVLVELRIHYEIACVCALPTPTPTMTPTHTPTPTMTQTPGASPSVTPTHTPTQTPTHTPTMTQTPTSTMTPTPTPTSKKTYYAYVICDARPNLTTSVIQPIPAIVGNMVNDVILDLNNNICWRLVEISDNENHLISTYGGTTYTNNYFTNVYGEIFSSQNTKNPCDDCKEVIKSLPVPVKSDCPTNLRNWSDCPKADVIGIIYVNDTIIYSFDYDFDVSLYLDTLPTNNGDYVNIVLTTSSSDTIVTLNVSYNDGVTYSQTSNTVINFGYFVKCDAKSQPDSIDIFSTCERVPPSIILYSTTYSEGGFIPTPAYSYTSNNSPQMVWMLNNFNGITVTSFEILCEDIDIVGSSPDGYSVLWHVTNIDPTQFNIASNGTWIGDAILNFTDGDPTSFNGWNGPSVTGGFVNHYRIQITANLSSGGSVSSNYSTFRATCTTPYC
jgi:hypothetical protein